MEKLLYHGSDHTVDHPHLHGSRRYNDYGYGLYCTREWDLACEWSAGPDRDGYVNTYRIDDRGLRIMRLQGNEYTVMNWLAVLLENRIFDTSSALASEGQRYILEHFRPDYDDSDIIIGYRADDSYFSFAQDFLNGTISVRQLAEAMHLGKLGLQYVLKTERAFERLEFLRAEQVPSEQWYSKRSARDQAARRAYFTMNRNSWQRGDLYMPMILDGEVKNDDPRLR